MNKKKFLIFATLVTFFFISFSISNYSQKSDNETLEYSVISIDAKSWIVTAKEVVSGNSVKFRLPPSAFKGKTFNANLKDIKKGQPFVVRGPRNALLEDLQMVEVRGVKKFTKKRHQKIRPNQFPVENLLDWEIIDIDVNNWMVASKNRKTGESIKFKVNPNGFIGFKFKANLTKIRQGQGFKMIAPNSHEFRNCCTLVKVEKTRMKKNFKR